STMPTTSRAGSPPANPSACWKRRPEPDESFDAVVCQFGIMFFPDKGAGKREAARVLRQSRRGARKRGRAKTLPRRYAAFL
ncbi:MAG: class I SAM-dependent methyltransferase, partial [Candidatus Eremiobacteraeota bacterium]|nr:class I SAM-dependent methyltransferase [Candidatus Eremiobacteraeota bacterium]